MKGRFALLTCLLLSSVTYPQQQGTGMFDLLIRGGTVIDGTGKRGVRAIVGILGDRIVFIGDARTKTARLTIEANGLIVAPGWLMASLCFAMAR